MSTTTNLDTLKINYLTQAQYDTALENDQINDNELYFTPSSGGGGGGGDGTSTPTANATAAFDSAAHMNSTDMTTQEVEDFIDGLDGQGANLADYVVEQGINGTWTYRKWNSGLYEAWGTVSASFAMTTALSPFYYAIGTFDISSLGFTTIKCLEVTGNAAGYYLFTKVEDYSTTQIRLTAFAQRSYTQTVTHHIQIIGT